MNCKTNLETYSKILGRLLLSLSKKIEMPNTASHLWNTHLDKMQQKLFKSKGEFETKNRLDQTEINGKKMKVEYQNDDKRRKDVK